MVPDESIEDKRAKYAKIVSKERCDQIWNYLNIQYGINTLEFKSKYGFAESKKGRIWIGSFSALEFIKRERFDPAKVLTVALGKADSSKLLADDSMIIRLTLDGALFFNTAITNNIINLTPEEEMLWNAGSVIERDNIENGVYIIASPITNHIVGSTVVKDGKLLNFVPKWRRWPRPEHGNGNHKNNNGSMKHV